MSRRPNNSKKAKAFFGRTATRTRVANVNMNIPRGGIRK